MTDSIRRLLAQIATFEAQSKAGLTPLPGELIEFFETAREARRDVRALESGMLPPEQKAPRVSPAVFIPIDTIGTRPLGRVAALMLDELHRATKTPSGVGPQA